jgi:hypothetical protein
VSQRHPCRAQLGYISLHHQHPGFRVNVIFVSNSCSLHRHNDCRILLIIIITLRYGPRWLRHDRSSKTETSSEITTLSISMEASHPRPCGVSFAWHSIYKLVDPKISLIPFAALERPSVHVGHADHHENIFSPAVDQQNLSHHHYFNSLAFWIHRLPCTSTVSNTFERSRRPLVIPAYTGAFITHFLSGHRIGTTFPVQHLSTCI